LFALNISNEMTLYWVNTPRHFTLYVGECEFSNKCCYAPDNIVYEKLYSPYFSGLNLAKSIHTFNFTSQPYTSGDQIYYSDIDSEEENNTILETPQNRPLKIEGRQVRYISKRGEFRVSETGERCQCAAVKFNKDCEKCNSQLSTKLTAAIRHGQEHSNKELSNEQEPVVNKVQEYVTFRTNKKLQRAKLRNIFGEEWYKFQSSDFKW
jgi:hypothetical protein